MKLFFKDSRPALALLHILLPVVALPAFGACVGFFTRQGVDQWYQTLQKSSLNPPDWVFGAVWTLLYVMMGLSLGLLWQKASRVPTRVFGLFALQLVLNLAWSFVFFQLHWLWVSTIWVAALIGLVGFLIVKIWPLHRLASLLLWPYLAWLGFALILSFGIVRLNG